MVIFNLVIYISYRLDTSASSEFSVKKARKGLTVLQPASPFGCAANSQFSGCYNSVVDADIINQAGEEAACFKSLAGTNVKATG